MIHPGDVMIRDKNIFECIFLEKVIFFPHYVIWGPASHGVMRRKHFFKIKFPTMSLSLSSKDSWEKLLKKHYDKRKIFSLDPNTKELTELDPQHFFTNAYGYPIKIGERIQLKSGIYEIKDLKVIRYAGLIASYILDGEIKKVDVGRMVWDKDLQHWKS